MPSMNVNQVAPTRDGKPVGVSVFYWYIIILFSGLKQHTFIASVVGLCLLLRVSQSFDQGVSQNSVLPGSSTGDLIVGYSIQFVWLWVVVAGLSFSLIFFLFAYLLAEVCPQLIEVPQVPPKLPGASS